MGHTVPNTIRTNEELLEKREDGGEKDSFFCCFCTFVFLFLFVWLFVLTWFEVFLFNFSLGVATGGEENMEGLGNEWNWGT